MHRALFIREIILDIFGHCSPTTPLDDSRHKADLAALARTCQIFKEPALDILWEELFDFSAVARCFPEACRFDGVCANFYCVDIANILIRACSVVLLVLQTIE